MADKYYVTHTFGGETYYKKKGYGWYGKSDNEMAYHYTKRTAQKLAEQLNAKHKNSEYSIEKVM